MQLTHPFAALGPAFSRPAELLPLQDPRLASWNDSAAALLGWQGGPPADFLEFINGERGLPHAPVASLYAGHQFGVWVPQLGDGRAAILGQVDSAENGPWELQVKGGGPTPFSRGGDGRAVLRSTIREYLGSEAVHGLNIASTRALALVDSSTPVWREQQETAALLVRLCPTHVRFGTFEVLASRGQTQELKTLADFVIENFYRDCLAAEQPYLAFYQAVIGRTAELVAGWMAQGFAHGVLNTDNMSILGVTLDYGPFAFMDAYEPGFICNHSDHHGRYAFDRQPAIALWNLSCLGSALLALVERGAAEEALRQFPAQYTRSFRRRMGAKLGLATVDERDWALVEQLLSIMARQRADYARTFRLLSRRATHDSLAGLFAGDTEFARWLAAYRERTAGVANAEATALAHNPKYLLRNYMAQIAIERAERGDYRDIERLLRLVQAPFAEHPDAQEYFQSPPAWAAGLQLSCSS